MARRSPSQLKTQPPQLGNEQKEPRETAEGAWAPTLQAWAFTNSSRLADV